MLTTRVLMLNYYLLHFYEKQLTSHFFEEQHCNRNSFLLAHLDP